jgi:hypothetical protein
MSSAPRVHAGVGCPTVDRGSGLDTLKRDGLGRAWAAGRPFVRVDDEITARTTTSSRHTMPRIRPQS